MSAIHHRSSNFQFELKLIQLKDLLDKTSLSATTQIPITFASLVQDVARIKKISQLVALLEHNLSKSCESKSSLNFVFLALKSVQYGLTITANQEYKPQWKDLTNDQLKIKIGKLQKKVDQLTKDYQPASLMKIAPELPKVVTTTSSSPENIKESELFNSIKGSLSMATGKFMRKMSFSGSGSVNKSSTTTKQSPTRMHVADVFSDQKKEQEVVVTTTNNNEVSPSKKEKEEVFFWQFGVLSNLSQNPPQILATLKDDLLNAIQKDPAFIMLSNSCKNDKEQTLFLESLVYYLDEVLFRVEKDLDLFEKDLNSQKAITKEKFVAYSFLLNLYYVSLELDKAYLEHKWIKPKLLDEMQDLLHFEKQLNDLAPNIKEIPCLKPVWLLKLDVEAKLAYAYLCSKIKWYTLVAFKKDETHKMDPLKSSELGHRKSVEEFPQWMLSIFKIQKS